MDYYGLAAIDQVGEWGRLGAGVWVSREGELDAGDVRELDAPIAVAYPKFADGTLVGDAGQDGVYLLGGHAVLEGGVNVAGGEHVVGDGGTVFGRASAVAQAKGRMRARARMPMMMIGLGLGLCMEDLQ